MCFFDIHAWNFSAKVLYMSKKHTFLKKYTIWAKLINPAYAYKFQLKTTQVSTIFHLKWIVATQEKKSCELFLICLLTILAGLGGRPKMATMDFITYFLSHCQRQVPL